jgi:PAS domain S-box-containing protein
MDIAVRIRPLAWPIRKPLRDYLSALALAGAVVLVHAIFAPAAPAIAYFGLLLPAVVVVGSFLGTGPALVLAGAGALGMVGLSLKTGLFAGQPPNETQLYALLFVVPCAVALWATHILRRSVATAGVAQARLAEVFRQIPGAAAILEAPTGRLLLRSAHSEAVLGHMQKRLEQSDDLVAYGGIHADGRPFTADDYPIVRALKTGEIVRGERIQYRRPDGFLADLEVHAGPVRGAAGDILASVGMAFDITERVSAERQLQESEALHRAAAGRLRAAVDASSLGLWEIDLATGWASLDARFASILGLPAEPVEMTRTELRDYVDAADRPRVAAVFAGATAGRGLYADECRIRTRQGDIRWIVSHGAVLADVQKVVGVVADITERRAREDTLQAALHARDILMREADHRIKNSLQLVVAVLRLQLAKVPDPDAKHMLSEAIARVDAVANAHLALQSSPDFQSVEVDRMLKDLCDRIGSLNPALCVVCDARAGVWLDADRAIPLGLLVSETLTNALKHAFPDGAAGEVRLTTKEAAGSLEIVIADGGVGLPATPSRPGLGTSVVKALSNQIGAVVTTESRPGSGTTVTVRLACGATPAVESRSPV